MTRQAGLTPAGSGVVPMERMKNNCTGMEAKLADMLLDPTAAPAKVQAHVAECDHCQASWRAAGDHGAAGYLEGSGAEPLLSEQAGCADARGAQAEPARWPASWLARLRARFAYGPSMHVRPLAAMAFTVMLLLGGGTYLGITNLDKPVAPAGQAAVVNDLQNLDSNAQVLSQMEALSSTTDNNGD